MIIIGGGIMGMSIAYHLQKLGTKTIVYDRQDKGQATKASAGIICPWVSQRRNKLWLNLVTKAAHYYPKFIEELEKVSQTDTWYKRNGALILFEDEKKYSKAYKRIKNNLEKFEDMINVKSNSVNSHPLLNQEYYNIFVQGGGQVKGDCLLEALKVGFTNLGGKITYQEYLEDNTNEVKIYATGAYGIEQDFLPKVSHQKAEILHIKTNGNYKNLPLIMHRSHYIVNLDVNYFVIGTTHIDTVSFDTTPEQENIDYLLKLFKHYFKHVKIESYSMTVGLRPYTRDYLPFIGEVKPNTYVLNGLGSSGLTAAPFLGKTFAEKLLNQPHDLDLSQYSYFE